jgi:hypothetical protein
MARNATSYDLKKAFLDYMNTLRTSFPCPTCRAHLNTYMDAHPVDAYWTKVDPTTGEDLGLFEYSFLFHNAVNVRIGKSVMDWETAKALYNPISGVCSLDCQEAH